MRRSVGMAVGAAVVSVTIGVLVGVVIHAGMEQRAESTAPTTTTRVTDSSSSTGLGSTDGFTEISSAEPGTVRTQSTAPLSRDTPMSDGATSSGPSQGDTPPATTPTTPTTSTTAAPSGPPSSSTPVPPRSTVTVTSTITSRASTQNGFNAASGPCSTLGAESSSANGTTLYCQRDQSDGTLRWRAVVAGGGCLNRAMTGIGADGATYECQLGTDGRNHWATAG